MPRQGGRHHGRRRMGVPRILTMYFPAETIWRNLYVHIPYCAGKCGYCAFYSETQSSLASRRIYLDALSDFLQRQEYKEPLETVYIGGGTPNFLTAAELAELFEAIKKIVPLTSDCEISCELNPELLTPAKMSVLDEHASRLSLGVQSFAENVRLKLMRKCSQEHLHNALKLLEKRRAKHFNIDLIYGVEGVDWQGFEHDICCAVNSGADHLSCYSLTVEENSRLGLQAPTADDSESADFWLKLGRFFEQYKFERYEISNYAAKNCQCRQNVNVWRGGTLLGVGAAAAGFDGRDRYAFKEDIDAFTSGEEPVFDRITPLARMLEILAVNLRTTAGWQKDCWEKLYPGTWEKISQRAAVASSAVPENWIITPERIALSESGLLFWDDAAMQIIDWEENWD